MNSLKYRKLFKESPISLWEEDFSEAKKYLAYLRKKGVSDLRNYFDKNLSELEKAVGKIKVLDINKATMNL